MAPPAFTFRSLIPDRLARGMSSARRRRHIRALIDAGQVSRAAGLVAKADPWPDGALWDRVDTVLDRDDWGALAACAPLAALRPPFERAVFDALTLVPDGGVEAACARLADMGENPAWDGFQRMCARAWAAFLTMPRFSDGGTKGARGPGILQFWEQGAPPADLKADMGTWRDLAAPEYRLLDGPGARDWLRARYGQEAARAYELCPHPAIKADYLRLGYLAEKGGLWIDADSRMAPRFPQIWPAMAGKTVLWFNTRTGHWLNGFIAAPPGDALMARAFHDAGARIRANPDQHPYLLAGPGLLTDTILWMHRDGLLGDVCNMTTAQVGTLVFSQVRAGYKRAGQGWQDRLGYGSAR